MNSLILLILAVPQTHEKMLEERVNQLTERLKLQDNKITIEKRDAKIEEIVEEFRKQANINIILDTTKYDASYRVKEFVLRGVPFNEAFVQFMKLTELTITDETPTTIKLERSMLATMAFKDSDIKEVIDALAKYSGANIIVSPEIKGTVSFSVSKVPWDIVLEYVVKTAGYKIVRESYSIIRIVTDKELQSQMETKIFKLKYLQPPSSYKAKIEKSKYIDGVPMLGPVQIKELADHFPIIRVIEATLTKQDKTLIGSMQYDFTSNSMVVKDVKPVLDKIEQIIKELDMEPPQVALDVKFIFTTNTDLISFGVDFFGINGITQGIELISKARRINPTQSAEYYSMFPFGFNMQKNPWPDRRYFLTQYETSAILRAFKQDVYTRVSQQPSISVLDNTEATIFVGQSVPYAEIVSVATQSGGSTTTIAEGKRSPVKVGFQLLIIPRITGDKVLITVIPENSVLIGKDKENPGFERFKISGQEIVLPRTSDTTLITRVMVEDSKTIILGGLQTENFSIEDRGVPILQDVPLINYFFRKKDESLIKEHLLIVITPRIVKATDRLAELIQQNLKSREKDAEKYLDDLKKMRKDHDPMNQMEKHRQTKEKEFQSLLNSKE